MGGWLLLVLLTVVGILASSSAYIKSIVTLFVTIVIVAVIVVVLSLLVIRPHLVASQLRLDEVTTAELPKSDALGRPIEGASGLSLRAGEIEVVIEEGRKKFVEVGPSTEAEI